MTQAQIRHTVTDAQGRPVRASVPVRLGSTGFVAELQSEIIAPSSQWSDSAGLVKFTLQRTSAITPAGTHYELTNPGGEVLSFVVPDGTPPHVGSDGTAYWWLLDPGVFVANPAAPSPIFAGASPADVAAAVNTAVAALLAGAPGALDTLNELAAALGDDANFAATVTGLLAGKAPLASPALTGAPTINGHPPVTADQIGTAAAQPATAFDPAGAATAAQSAAATDATNKVAGEASARVTALAPMVARWAPLTSYPTVGVQLISPNNDVVSVLVPHTSTGVYDPTKFGLSGTYAPWIGSQANPDDGIGATPLARLHVKEATRAETARFEGNGQGQVFFYDGATQRGRVGFGGAGNIFSGLLANAIGIRSESAIQLGVGSSVVMTMREIGWGPGTGYVGFGGKTDPASQVELGGEASPELSLTSETPVTGKRYGLTSYTDGSFYIFDRSAATNVMRVAPTTRAVTFYGALDIGANLLTAGGGTITSAGHNAFTLFDTSHGSGLGATQLVLQSASGGGGAGVRFLSQETGTNTFPPQAAIEAEGETSWNAVATASSFLRFATSNAGTLIEALRITAKQNVLLAKGAPGTAATDGYPYIPADAGAPTGVPTANAGFAAMKYDTTNHKLWCYDGGWKGVVLA